MTLTEDDDVGAADLRPRVDPGEHAAEVERFSAKVVRVSRWIWWAWYARFRPTLSSCTAGPADLLLPPAVARTMDDERTARTTATQAARAAEHARTPALDLPGGSTT